jgi:soluble lytic murein transglycosylase-like protein
VTLSAIQTQCLTLIGTVLAQRPAFAWIKPSFIMATIQIESSFRPTVVNAAQRQDGLCQVIPSTVALVEQKYNLGNLPPQTDPATSILCGMCYWDFVARELIAGWKVAAIPVSAVVEGYNEGEAAAEKGIMVPKYWADWIAAWPMYTPYDPAPIVSP